MKGVESIKVKNKVIRSHTILDHIITVRVDGETYLKILDIVEEADTSISHLIRRGLDLVLELESDYVHYLPLLCKECGGRLSAILGTDKAYCMRCGKIYILKEVEGK